MATGSQSTSAFSVWCQSKNRRPQCDQAEISLDNQSTNPQGVLYVSDPVSAGDITPANSFIEVGADSGGNPTMAVSLLSPGVGFAGNIPVTSSSVSGGGTSPIVSTANPRRLSVSLPGIYHFDITLSYGMSTGPSATTVLRIGPTVFAGTNLSYRDLNSTANSQSYDSTTDADNIRTVHVAGNLSLNAGYQVGMFYNNLVSGGAINIRNLNGQLQLTRISALL